MLRLHHRIPFQTLATVVALVAGIALVEVGVRDPAGRAVDVPIPSSHLRSGIDRVRAVPIAHIRDARAAAVASGVVFGRTDHVASDDEQAFLASGLWHLLAASGQNIALVAATSILLARMLGVSRTGGAALALIAIPGYVAVVGGGASIVRAGLMGELALIVWLSGKLGDVRQTLLVAATAICWMWPGAHRGLGMQLSFACVVGLALWATPCTRRIRDAGVPTWLAGAVAATIICGLVTAPILSLRTGATPLMGTVANLVAVPLAGALLVVGLACTALALFADALGAPAAADVVVLPMTWLSQLLLLIAHRAAALPAAQSTSRAVGVVAPALILFATVLPPRLRQVMPRLAGGLIAVAVACALFASVPAARSIPGVHALTGTIPPAPAGVLRIGVLDIGQGDATLLATSDGAILVDAGPPNGRVVERVRALGVRRVDGIVLTHDSLDHRGGYPAAYDALHPRWVAKPRAAPGPWRRIRAATPAMVELCVGDQVQLGSVRIDVLHPRCDGTIQPRTTDLHNDGAMVLLVSHGAVRVLLPADAEAPVLVGLPLPLLDLLRVSHHGSEDPALPTLLARTRPRAAAISVGAGNDYGHPRARTLAALRAAGVPIARTDRDGTIRYESDGRSLERR